MSIRYTSSLSVRVYEAKENVISLGYSGSVHLAGLSTIYTVNFELPGSTISLYFVLYRR